MKKLGFVAVMLMVGASVAFASSISVPWYIDNAGINNGLTPPAGLTQTLIYLKNNASTVTVVQISYNADDGTALGPPVGSDTFEILPNATILFRPVADDTNLATGGQEDPGTGGLVPNRPRGVNTKKNGSITLRFEGGPSLVQGEVTAFFTPDADGAQTVTYSYLIPSGN